MQNELQLDDLSFSFFGQHSNFKGHFTLEGPTYIAGSVEGEIFANGAYLIRIESVGKVIGTIRAHNVDIYGEVQGKIQATGTVTIYATARVSAEIHSGNLIIHPGAQIEMEAHTGIN